VREAAGTVGERLQRGAELRVGAMASNAAKIACWGA
jgi:hypothetical protein